MVISLFHKSLRLRTQCCPKVLICFKGDSHRNSVVEQSLQSVMHANSLVTIFRLMKLTRDENVTLFNLSRILNSSYSFLFPISDPSTYNINQSSICHKITHVIHIIQENLIQICHLDFKSSSINLRK